MMKVFVTRRYFVIGYSGAKRYLEEAAFSSLERAQIYIERISDDEDDCGILSEIVEYEVDSKGSEEECCIWYYDYKGDLLLHETKDFLEEMEESAREQFRGEFQVGDIVFIRAYPWNKRGGKRRDVLGVVAFRPMSKKDWVSTGAPSDDWDYEYRVYYVGDAGFLEHDHFNERSMERHDEEIAEDSWIIELLSEYFKGKKEIDRSILEKIFGAKIVVRGVKSLDLSES